MSQVPSAPPGPRRRAYVVAGLLVVASLYWMMWIDLVVHVGVVSKMALAYHALLIMLVACGVNALVGRLRPGAQLTGGELVMVYTCMFMACSIAGLDFMQMLPPTLTHPFWFATPENHYEAAFFTHLPRWLMMDDERVLTDVYEGGAGFHRWSVIRLWLKPAVLWCGLTGLIVVAGSFLNALVRRRWMDGEKLSFPLTALPLNMSVAPGQFFSNSVLWIGFGLAAAIDLLAGLNHLYPAVPHLDIRSYRPVRIFDSMPWRAVGPLELGANPFVVGLGFFLPLPVLFSCWFFFVFTKIQLVACALMGAERDRRMPYLPQQTFGAYFALVIITFSAARSYWSGVFRAAVGGPAGGDDKTEPLRYRVALGGFVICLVGLVAFSCLAGMSLPYAIVFFAVYFSISLTLTRIRAEIGPPAHDLPYASPGEILVGFGGSKALGPRDLTASILFLPFTRGYRTHPMPVQLEGLKMAQQSGLPQASMLTASLVTGVASTLLVFYFVVGLYYRHGAATAVMRGESIAYTRTAYNLLASWMRVGTGPDYKSLWFVLGGAVFTLALNAGKATYPWWSLFPTGYALQGGWMMRHIWVALLVTWVIKSAMMRYGGAKLYYRARPFFFGLALGEFVMGSLWSLVAILRGVHTWSFWS